MSSEALGRLAELAGIEAGWWDFFGTYRLVPDDTKRAFLAAMGFAVATDVEVVASLAEFEARPWRRWLEPVQVVAEDQPPPVIPITVADPDERVMIGWTVTEEDGTAHHGEFCPRDLPMLGEAWLDGILRRRHAFHLPGMPLPGLHRFSLQLPGGGEAGMSLIVAPPAAFRPPQIRDGGRLWGYATQLYALRSDRNWGVGDFTDLGELGGKAAAQGAAAIGVNPLHALFSNQPERFAPYSPSSRLFINVVHVDVEAVPDFQASTEARRLFASPGFQARLGQAQKARLVDYPTVWQLKRPILEACWRTFSANHLDAEPTGRGAAFRAFREASGRNLERYAAFEALQAHFMGGDPAKAYWRNWPAEYHDPDGPAVERFVRTHPEQVGFHIYLQWLADLQLGAAQASCRSAGMALGVYRDLGVGIAADGAEAWANQDLLCLGVSVGAPPDPLNMEGQDWGLVPFNPVALREAGYRPFLSVLEANMRHAGAMRLDHAMSLQRLYWVPQGLSATQGAYLRYPMADLLALVTLASCRSGCLVIGEDLGTVPDGFREQVEARAVLGYRLMVFEKMDGRYKAPAEVPAHALVSFGTHDLPCLMGWWTGIDIASRRRLKLYKDPSLGQIEAEQRGDDRRLLVEALVKAGLLEKGFPCTAELTQAQQEQLASAVYGFLERTPSVLLMVQFEDLLGLLLQMNLPGTTTQHPNWRVRYPMPIDAMVGDRRVIGAARELSGRAASNKP